MTMVSGPLGPMLLLLAVAAFTAPSLAFNLGTLTSTRQVTTPRVPLATSSFVTRTSTKPTFQRKSKTTALRRGKSRRGSRQANARQQQQQVSLTGAESCPILLAESSVSEPNDSLQPPVLDPVQITPRSDNVDVSDD